MKTLSENTLQAYKVARRMGATMKKRVICAGCGKVSSIDAVDFELLALDGKLKEVVSEKADGVHWCTLCA